MFDYLSFFKENEKEIEFYTDVIVLNCGGTIDMAGDIGISPADQVNQTLTNLKNEEKKLLASHITVNVFKRAPDSSSLGGDDLKNILDNVKRIIERKIIFEEQLRRIGLVIDVGGIVITHGTDTMQNTALLLALEFSVLPLPFPIVLTGSHSPMTHEKSDGLKNILKAISVALNPVDERGDKLPPGVYVLFGQEIHLGARINKVRTMPDDEGRYFFSFPAIIGNVIGYPKTRLRVSSEYIGKLSHGASSELKEIKKLDKPCVVEHIVLDSKSSFQIMDDFRNRMHIYMSKGFRRIGLIIQGNFKRNPSYREITNRFFEDEMANCVICLGSAEVFNDLALNIEVNNITLIPKSMSHSKAQTKLKWLLDFDITIDNVKLLMNKNVSGEIFNVSYLPEWIKYENFPVCENGREVVIIYPDIHPQVLADAVGRIETHKSGVLYLYGFGDGHIPAPNKSISDIVVDFLISEGFKIDPNELNGSVKLDEVHEKLSKWIRQQSQNHGAFLESYIMTSYKLNWEYLKAAFVARCSRKERDNMRYKFQNFAQKVYDHFNGKPGNIVIKNREQLTRTILDLVTFESSHDELVNYLPKHFQKGYPTDQQIASELIGDYSELFSQRLIKDALMKSSPLFSVIGRAIDSGIKVIIKTLAIKSKTNTSKYEVGNMLHALGVHCDAHKGWKTRYLLRKATR